ncbi:MAG TPA: IS66 family insertion sequence element accessory protein TnpB [Vicinamibacterales bacterium]|nr:IS66 family insertion sequence element accessory protein TnpB [Vicinamibacterales bacterium]
MLSVAQSASIYVHMRPTDMRKGFDGLCGIVRQEFGSDPLDGSLFLFINRRRDRIKILYWDRDGLALWYKRLEAGTFERIESGDSPSMQIDATQLAMLLGGVSLGAAKERRKRYQHAA